MTDRRRWTKSSLVSEAKHKWPATIRLTVNGNVGANKANRDRFSNPRVHHVARRNPASDGWQEKYKASKQFQSSLFLFDR